MNDLTTVAEEQVPAKAHRVMAYHAFDEYIRDVDALCRSLQPIKDLRDRIKYVPLAGMDRYTSVIRGDHDAILEEIDKAEALWNRLKDRCAELDEIQKAHNTLCVGYDEDPERFEVEWRKHVAKQVALLLGSFPTHNVPDPKVFTRMLIEEVAATYASWECLECAFRKIRRTSKTVPSIAAVLAVIEEEELAWGERNLDMSFAIKALRRVRKDMLALEALKRIQASGQNAEAAIPLNARVTHIKFGIGTVVSAKEQQIGVKFDCGQEKLLLASFLERVAVERDHAAALNGEAPDVTTASKD
jgi:hypothetical protein